MPSRFHSSRPARYTYAVLAAAVVLFIRLSVRHEITDSLNPYPFLLFHIPVLFSAWFFGRGGGLVATLVSAASVHYFLLPPAGSFYLFSFADLLPLAVFIAEGIVISVFASAKRDAERKLDERVRERTQELETAHKQLAQSETLAVLGIGISKIAHEMANRVNSLSVGIQVLQMHNAKHYTMDTELRSTVEDLNREINLLGSFINELRQVSKPAALNPAPVSVPDIRDIIDGLIRTYSNLGKQAIEVEQQLPAGLPSVMADRFKLQEVFSNLWKNAVEAMPNGGKITVRAYREHDKVCIEIEDTGVGIPKDMNVFELFTTSKERGWGLGLPIVYQIIRAQNGAIDYTSKPGEGTTFRIALPIASGEHPRPSVSG
jgi:signal transduction histidine kinase